RVCLPGNVDEDRVLGNLEDLAEDDVADGDGRPLARGPRVLLVLAPFPLLATLGRLCLGAVGGRLGRSFRSSPVRRLRGRRRFGTGLRSVLLPAPAAASLLFALPLGVLAALACGGRGCC